MQLVGPFKSTYMSCLKKIGMLLLCCCAGVCSLQAKSTWAKVKQPIKVTVKLHILKIYDINTVTQTFSLDGFLTLMWKAPDEEKPYKPLFLVDNQEVSEAFRDKLWWPNIDFINIEGERHIPYRRVVMDSQGYVTYTERFYATMGCKMDFKKFPFDNQLLLLQLESFGFSDTVMVFDRQQKDALNTDDITIVEWDITGSKTYVNEYLYKTHLRKGAGFNRFNIEIEVHRNPGFYIWEFFLPLTLLILLSWFVFWIANPEVQISLAFTLMLTLVAYSFYSSSYLPRLPYNTFIQSTVIAGYIVIFVLIAAIVVKYVLLAGKRKRAAARLDNIMKWGIPVLTLSVLGWLWQYFF